MACLVLIGSSWIDGKIKGWAAVGTSVAVMVAGSMHYASPEHVKYTVAGIERTVQPGDTFDLPDHLQTEIVPATPFGQTVNASGAITTTTTTAIPTRSGGTASPSQA